MWCCIQEGLFKVGATAQPSRSQPVTLLRKQFCYNQPYHLQLLLCSPHQGLAEASLQAAEHWVSKVRIPGVRSGIEVVPCLSVLPTTNMLAAYLASIGTPSVKIQRFWLCY